jgi:hypothetical protein
MKNLKEHTPNPNSWERILKQSQFENQLANHLDRLPQYPPNDESWGKITEAMDRKRIVPIWLKWGVAASIVGILIIAGISVSNIETDPKSQITQVLPDQASGNLQKNESGNSTKILPSDAFPPNESAQITSKESVASKKPTKRKVEIIEIPKINLPELKPNISENLSINIPEPQPSEPSQAKTLHQVNISWSKIKPGLQVTTSFGRKEINPTTKTQASANSQSQITLEINN